MKKICLTLLVLLSMMAAQATVLLKDSSNYPYNDGTIEGQGQWYCYLPATPKGDADVTNNILYMSTANSDSVATPSNGWVNPTEYNYASFELNVSQLPGTTNGSYFAEFQNNDDTNDVCHLFIDTRDTTVPGTYRLGIANFSTSFSAAQPPVNFPMDLATGVTYTVVMYYDTNQASAYVGCNLWINPSEMDYENFLNGFIISPHIGEGYVYNNDGSSIPAQLNIHITQIGFSPYVNAGISNVIAANTFDEVNTYTPPAFGIQPQSQTNNYSGNSTTFYAVASGVDVTYQWYSTNYGALNDGGSPTQFGGATFVGSTSNTLVVNNEVGSDGYYAVATDADSDSTSSLTATNLVNTTPTAPFFSQTPITVTSNLFTSASFTDGALGTGPLSYQWYFAPTNVPAVYSRLSGQNGPTINVSLDDYTYAGTYYVVASNSVSGGSIAYGPTNTLVILQPVVATIQQLHNLMVSMTSIIIASNNKTIYINHNNVTVGGYVTSWNGGVGNATSSDYTEYFMQDAAGYGIEVFVNNVGNTNNPPVGTFVSVSGPVEVFDSGLEIAPTALSAITTNSSAPVVPLPPILGNAYYLTLATNGFGSFALDSEMSLFTFTNVYIYGTKTGGALGTGTGSPNHTGVNDTFFTNGYTQVYFTIGQYGTPASNTNAIEIFQPTYTYGTATNTPGYTNAFFGLAIPTNCYQLTGVYVNFEGTPEIEPTRPQDWVNITNVPPVPTINISENGGVPTITASNLQAGSTYSVPAATSLTGTWTNAAYGLGYWPTNVSFTDSKITQSKFYQVTSP